MTDSLRAAAQAVLDDVGRVNHGARLTVLGATVARLRAALAQAEERDAAVEELVEAVANAASALGLIADRLLVGKTEDALHTAAREERHMKKVYESARRRLSSTPEEEQG